MDSIQVKFYYKNEFIRTHDEATVKHCDTFKPLNSTLFSFLFDFTLVIQSINIYYIYIVILILTFLLI